jgi:hypothetical protein
VKLAPPEVWTLPLPGPLSITVSGGSTSPVALMIQVRSAGAGSVFPAASIALTANVWEPVAKPEYDLPVNGHELKPLASRLHWNVDAPSVE